MTASGPDENIETIWRFLRGDMPVLEFEQWVYGEKTLESTLGPDLYLELISASFKSKDSAYQIKEMLRGFAEARDMSACRCIRVGRPGVIDMGHENGFFDSLEQIAVRGDPYWWLLAYRCRHCGTTWLVAQEERQNDLYCVHALVPSEAKLLSEQGSWPNYFDRYETLLRMGRDAGRSVSFLDPLTSSMRYTVEDLAKERPGIRVSELASLLSLDQETAETLARRAESEAKVKIEFDV